jgi:hypothetical protein
VDGGVAEHQIVGMFGGGSENETRVASRQDLLGPFDSANTASSPDATGSGPSMRVPQRGSAWAGGPLADSESQTARRRESAKNVGCKTQTLNAKIVATTAPHARFGSSTMPVPMTESSFSWLRASCWISTR